MNKSSRINKGRRDKNYASAGKTSPVFRPAKGRKYIAFNKPFEVLVQFTPEKLADGNVSEKVTLADFNFPPHVYPVGRLDFDSEGLLLLSDDGRLTTALFEGEAAHERTYLTQVENVPGRGALDDLAQGVLLSGGVGAGKKTKPCRVRLLEHEPDLPERSKPVRFRKSIPTAWLEMRLTQGLNRQVRRMTAAVGHPTLRIYRVAIGDLHLADLDIEPGQWRELSEDEVLKVFL